MGVSVATLPSVLCPAPVVESTCYVTFIYCTEEITVTYIGDF